MQALTYYLTLPILYGISWLPFPLLYLLSDFVYFWLYRVFGYRKEVVRKNLVNSFPEKTEQEIIALEKKFYEWFFDLMLETLKTLTVSPKALRKRVTFENGDVYQRFKDKGQSVIIVMGHYGNWEFAGAACALEDYHQLNVIYHPLKNKYFNRLIYKMRTRLGNGLYPMREVTQCMIRDKDKLTATAFIADQTPAPERGYWTTFMNQDTPIFKGTEKYAKKFGYPVIYTSIDRPKRGYYVVCNEVLIEDPSSMGENEISELQTRRLEKDILSRPEIWLWTHRRWKHERPEGI